MLAADLKSFNQLATLPFVQDSVNKVLKGSNNQSEPFERDVPDKRSQPAVLIIYGVLASLIYGTTWSMARAPVLFSVPLS